MSYTYWQRPRRLRSVSGVRSVQHRIAGVLIKSMVAICTAIGTQPIPLADFPILLSLQVTLVAGIMYVSGREMSMRLAGEELEGNVIQGVNTWKIARHLLKCHGGRHIRRALLPLLAQWSLDDPLPFLDSDQLIGAHVGEPVHHAAGPSNFDQVSLGHGA